MTEREMSLAEMALERKCEAIMKRVDDARVKVFEGIAEYKAAFKELEDLFSDEEERFP
jgi:hypothetical protein